jgi:hypothetical protein
MAETAFEFWYQDRAGLEGIDRLRSADKNAIRPFHVNVPEAELTEL